MQLKRLLVASVVVLGVLLGGCANIPPSKPNNICHIFDDKSGWYDHARSAEKRWGSSIPVMMAILYHESRFVHNARTKRTKILWIIPGPRKSNAFGYAQVKNATWKEYQKSSGNNWSRRDRFQDAVDFVGWYNEQSRLRSKIKLNDPYNLYLAYHEGHGGFNRGTYKNKAWLKAVARNVSERSAMYTSQLAGCEKRLRGSWWWPF
jgi:hypothetical protein